MRSKDELEPVDLKPAKKKPAISTDAQFRIINNSLESAKLFLKEGELEEAIVHLDQALRYCPDIPNTDIEKTVYFTVKTWKLICDFKLAMTDQGTLNGHLTSLVSSAEELKGYAINQNEMIARSLDELIRDDVNINQLFLKLQMDLHQLSFANNLNKCCDTATKLCDEGNYLEPPKVISLFLNEYADQLQSISTEQLLQLFNAIDHSYKIILGDKNLSVRNFIEAIESINFCARVFAHLTPMSIDIQQTLEARSIQYHKELVLRVKTWLDSLRPEEQTKSIAQLLETILGDHRLPDHLKSLITLHCHTAAQEALIRHCEYNCQTHPDKGNVILKAQLIQFNTQVKKLVALSTDEQFKQTIILSMLATLRRCSVIAHSTYEKIIRESGSDLTRIRKAFDTLILFTTELKNEAKSLLPNEGNLPLLEAMKLNPGLNSDILISITSAYLMLLPCAETSGNFSYCISEALKAIAQAEQLVSLIPEEDLRAKYLNEIHSLKVVALDNNSNPAMACKISDLVSKCRLAKESQNYPALIASCLELITLKKEVEVFHNPSQLPMIASFGSLHYELALAHVGAGDMVQAQSHYQMSLSYEPNNVQAIEGMQAILITKRSEYNPHDTKRYFADLELKKAMSQQLKANLLSKLPPHVAALFKAVIQGEAQAYEMLKVFFSGAIDHFSVLSQFILMHEDDELKYCQINALYDVASNIQKGKITIQAPKKSDLFLRLYTLAANRNFPLALYSLGRYEESLYEFEKAKSSYEKASKLGLKEATRFLALAHKRNGEYGLARTVINELMMQKDLNDLQRNDLKDQLAQIDFLEHLAVDIPRTPINISKKENKCIIYIDFDNTLMKSQDYPNTFYKLYPKGGDCPQAVRNNLNQFYTGSDKDWKEIFEELKKMGMTIGICTARFEVPGKQCVLFKQFLKDFGKYLDRDHIIFTNGKDKYRPLVESCHTHGILRKNALLVDDTEPHVLAARAHGMSAIHAAKLVTEPKTFGPFRKHLLKTAEDMVAACKKSRDQVNDECEYSGNEVEEPATPIYSTPQVTVPAAAVPVVISGSRSSFYGGSRSSPAAEPVAKKSKTDSPRDVSGATHK